LIGSLLEKKNDVPFFWYLAHNAAHFPLQAPVETINKYKGKYMKGWEDVRNARFKKQLELGLFERPDQLTPRNPKVPEWDSLTQGALATSAQAAPRKTVLPAEPGFFPAKRPSMPGSPFPPLSERRIIRVLSSTPFSFDNYGHIVDIMPTLVKLTGATYPSSRGGHKVPPMEGISLLPLLKGEPVKQTKPTHCGTRRHKNAA